MSRDYFTYEVIRSALVALGDEMFSALKRAAMSPIIYETLDFAVGATDARGQLICQGNGGTGFLGTLDAAVGYVIARYQGRIEPGDVFITNDPYEGGGTHLSDVTLVLPVFFGGELVAFVANKAHWTEVGGKSPGSFTSDATEIYQEGLQFPNIRLFSRGAINEPLVDLIRANVRLPDQSLGDMWAQIAGLRVGERRLLDLFGRYGRGTMLGAIDHLLDYGERMSRRALKGLPKGTFEAEDEIDDDGFGNGPFAVRVKVTITDDEFVADYTGSHPQVKGPINTPATGLRSRVRAIYRAITTPDIPTNGGMFGCSASSARRARCSPPSGRCRPRSTSRAAGSASTWCGRRSPRTSRTGCRPGTSCRSAPPPSAADTPRPAGSTSCPSRSSAAGARPAPGMGSTASSATRTARRSTSRSRSPRRATACASTAMASTPTTAGKGSGAAAGAFSSSTGCWGRGGVSHHQLQPQPQPAVGPRRRPDRIRELRGARPRRRLGRALQRRRTAAARPGRGGPPRHVLGRRVRRSARPPARAGRPGCEGRLHHTRAGDALLRPGRGGGLIR